MRRTAGVFLAAIIVSMTAAAQSSKKTGLFYLTNIEHRFNDRWSLYVENQWRSIEGLQKFYYYELKSGLSYAFNKNYSVTVGTGIYETFRDGAEYEFYSKQFENRLWEQFNADHQLSVIALEHRLRIEQRFKDEYENRFRYRLKADVPLNRRTIEAKTLFLTVSDELFFDDTARHFSRNRFLAGGGYKFSNTLGLNVGWMRQEDFSEEKTRRKNYVYTAVNIKI